ncbi:hypothetical protein LF1_49300 [Rubripirellula obstinata]|uniref:DUF4340 domain-containing protein n=1 Tax=Rubripirellula obstinata TaxID=406547 RepID=A0A5B1CP94_9BACT|nr:DUF4340 domain-containing protein [Rubripirellula obstinata]KAA1262366.1 hypothetical protein LF1_49300 [Rubripirellula obstinata]
MSEATKTLTFCGVAAVVAGLATFVAWPSATKPTDEQAGKMLFAEFKDPLAAASMKIVTFDEEQGKLDTFEVRKDRETELWTIPSRDGYPADAIEQMKVAANALVDVKILDVQTTNAEDHDDLGVVEPKMETLEVGDEGVGRLVTFKNEKQDTLASMIIGDAVKEDESKRYVRIPNQDPVYVVKFDDSSLTTNFTDWIEDDLLQLSSIDIDQVEIKDYTASLGQRGISLNRRYTAVVDQENNDWKLAKLSEYDEKDPRKEPVDRELSGDEPLNKTKLNEMKNALDDLKIVGVFRKPEGVSETLKASKDLLSDQEAITSLAQRGFYPIDVGPDGQAEILSANGELSVSLDAGVKYLLRFGNIAGVSDGGDGGDGDEADDTGVNRYLFVTTMVDQSKFPAPELQSVPQTLEEMDALMAPPEEEQEAVETEPVEEVEAEADEATGEEATGEEETEEATEAGAEMTSEEPAQAEASKEVSKEVSEESPAEDVTEGETEASGEGEATGSGQAQSGDVDEDAPAVEEVEADAEEAKADEEIPAESGLTDEERQELLEAAQEKITKSNQRLLDARKDQLAEAEKKVNDLNARFADWYYVIPETTYTQLRISQEELLKQEAEKEQPAGNPMQGGPQLQMPGFPGGGN